MLNEHDMTTLEQLIDTNSLQHVLDAIVSICHGKSEHLAVNWQDPRSAHVWDRAAIAIAKASEDKNVAAA